MSTESLSEDSLESYIHFYMGLKRASTFSLGAKVPWSELFSWGKGETFALVSPIDPTSKSVEWVSKFTGLYGPAYMIPLFFLSRGLGFGLRSLKEKRFSTLLPETPGFYTAFEAMKLQRKFVYGTPIFLVEGVLDAEAVSTVYPWVIAILTSRVTEAQVFVLSMVTKTVLLGFDNDSAGQRGMRLSEKTFRERGMKVLRVPPPSLLKDWGDVLSLSPTAANEEMETLRQILLSKGVSLCV